MLKNPLGKTGLHVSQLGFGSAPAAFLGTEKQRAVDLLNTLLDAGMNVIDTAAMYPGSEKFIGENLSHRRDEYVLISKCGTKVEGIDAPLWSKALIEQTVDQALKFLKTDVIDVMLLHTCDLKTLLHGEGLAALVAAKKAGKIRFAGYSGDNEAVAHAVALDDVDVVEMSINITDQVNIDNGLRIAQEKNKGVIAKRPVANAAWKKIDAQPGMYKAYAQKYTDRFAAMKLSPGDLGFKNDDAWPEIALRFTLSLPGVSTAVVGTTNPINANANLKYVNNGPLPAKTVAAIREAFKQAQPSEGWPGLT